MSGGFGSHDGRGESVLASNEALMRDYIDRFRRAGYGVWMDDFGDAVIRETGRKLLNRCGNQATVGRMSGGSFRVLRQFEDPAEMTELVAAIRRISAEPFRINGGTLYAYLSVGMALYSESGDSNIMTEQAEMRRLMDDAEHRTPSRLFDHTKRIFHAFDDLPLAYAAFRLLDEKYGADGLLLYVNRAYFRMTGLTPEETLGRRVSELFSPVDERWLAMATAAGRDRKTLRGRLPVPHSEREVDVTAYPVIGPGFFACAFSDAPVAPPVDNFPPSL